MGMAQLKAIKQQQPKDKTATTLRQKQQQLLDKKRQQLLDKKQQQQL